MHEGEEVGVRVESAPVRWKACTGFKGLAFLLTRHYVLRRVDLRVEILPVGAFLLLYPFVALLKGADSLLVSRLKFVELP